MRASGLSPSPSMVMTSLTCGLMICRVRAMRRSTWRCWRGSRSTTTWAVAPKSPACSQPTISLWFISGSVAQNAGCFAFSLNWHFHRNAVPAVTSAP